MPRENDPVDIQALCMAIEDRLDQLHDTPGQDAHTMRAQYETQFDVLHRHLERLTAAGDDNDDNDDTHNISGDVESIIELRNAINMTQELLFEPVGAESTQDLVDRLQVMSIKQIRKEFKAAAKNVEKRRNERANSSKKERKARWSKPFASAKRKWRAAGTKRAEAQLRKLINALKIVEVNGQWSNEDQRSLQFIWQTADRFLKSGNPLKPTTGDTDADWDDYTTPALPPRDDGDVATTNDEFHMTLPERRRVIPLKTMVAAEPVGAFIRVKKGANTQMTDQVLWENSKFDTEAEKDAYTRLKDKSIITVQDLKDHDPSLTNMVWNKMKNNKYKKGNQGKWYARNEFLDTPQIFEEDTSLSYDEVISEWSEKIDDFGKNEITGDLLLNYFDELISSIKSNDDKAKFTKVAKNNLIELGVIGKDPVAPSFMKTTQRPTSNNDPSPGGGFAQQTYEEQRQGKTGPTETKQDPLYEAGVGRLENEWAKFKKSNEPNIEQFKNNMDHAINIYKNESGDVYDRLEKHMLSLLAKAKALTRSQKSSGSVNPRERIPASNVEVSSRWDSVKKYVPSGVKDMYDEAVATYKAAGAVLGLSKGQVDVEAEKLLNQVKDVDENKRGAFIINTLKRDIVELKRQGRDDGALNYPHRSGYREAHQPSDPTGERNYYYGGGGGEYDDYREDTSWEIRKAPQTLNPMNPNGRRNYYYGDDDDDRDEYTW